MSDRDAPGTPDQAKDGASTPPAAGGDYGLGAGPAGAPAGQQGAGGVNPNTHGVTGADGAADSAWHYREFTDREYDNTRDYQQNANYGRPSGGDYGTTDGGQQGATGGEAGHAASGGHGGDAPPAAAGPQATGGEPSYADGSHSRTSRAPAGPDAASDYGNAPTDQAAPPDDAAR